MTTPAQTRMIIVGRFRRTNTNLPTNSFKDKETVSYNSGNTDSTLHTNCYYLRWRIGNRVQKLFFCLLTRKGHKPVKHPIQSMNII